jgi:superfamily I DNA/RNA helicase
VQAAAPAELPERGAGGQLFGSISDEDLLLAGVPEPLLPAVRALRAEAELDALAPHLPEDAAEILVGLAAGYSLTDAMAEADRVRRAQPVDTADFAVALGRPESQQRFRIVEDDQDLSAMLDAPLQQWRIFLHPSQRRLVGMRSKGPVRVLGGAGTGKTVVLMHRARHLVRELFRGRDDRILVTTFTRNLALDLAANLEHLCGRDAERVEVVHLHAWAARFLRRQGQALEIVEDRDARAMMQQAVDQVGDLGLPPGFFFDEWRRVVQPQDLVDAAGYLRARRVGRGTRLTRRQRAEVWAVFGRYRELLDEAGQVEWADVVRNARQWIENHGVDVPYRAVLADEVQDFDAGELRLLRALVPPGPDDLFVVGDGHQRIYGQPVALGSCGIDIRGRSRRLRVNYRTTEEIRNFAVAVLEGLPVDDLDGGLDSLRGYTSLRAGLRPEVVLHDDEAAEARFVVETVRRWLGSGSAAGICVAARTNALLRGRYQQLLEQAGIQCAPVRTEADAGLPAGAVRLATMHRMKGLEFARVLLAGVQDGTMPQQVEAADEGARAEHELQERCLFYVASSRARDELVVTGFGRRSGLFGAE